MKLLTKRQIQNLGFLGEGFTGANEEFPKGLYEEGLIMYPYGLCGLPEDAVQE